MSTQSPEPMAHEYDGIREYDNPTPGWWHLLLWGTIVFSICYALWVHVSIFATTPQGRWNVAQQEYYQRLFGDIGTLEGDDATIMQMAGDEKWMALGQSIFIANCGQCHANDGTGGIGPNLTDDHYINVDQVADIYDIVTDGVVAKGMPAWKSRLGQNQRVLVAAYAATLRGSTSGGKPPEGEIIPPWNAGDDEAATTSAMR